MTHNAAKFIVGAFFTVLGILMTLSNLEFGDAHIYLRYWPVVLIGVGIIKFVEPGTRILGLLMAMGGLTLLAGNIRWIRFSIFDLWPAVLIIIGVLVVSNALGWRPAPTLTSGSNVVAVFSERKVQAVEGEQRVVAFMGACEVSLPEPRRERPPLVIEALAMWGGIELHVPDGWDVQGELLPVMGGFEISSKSNATPVQKVIVRGLAFMGGVVVKRRMA